VTAWVSTRVRTLSSRKERVPFRPVDQALSQRLQGRVLAQQRVQERLSVFGKQGVNPKLGVEAPAAPGVTELGPVRDQ